MALVVIKIIIIIIDIFSIFLSWFNGQYKVFLLYFTFWLIELIEAKYLEKFFIKLKTDFGFFF